MHLRRRTARPSTPGTISQGGAAPRPQSSCASDAALIRDQYPASSELREPGRAANPGTHPDIVKSGLKRLPLLGRIQRKPRKAQHLAVFFNAKKPAAIVLFKFRLRAGNVDHVFLIGQREPDTGVSSFESLDGRLAIG